VFGLTGGEMSLADETWCGYAYHYDGAPDYAESELKAAAEERGLDPWSLITVIVTHGGFLPPPEETLTDAAGNVWTLLASFANSGETECPGQHDERNKVTRIDCGPKARPSDEYDSDKPPSPPDRCVLCEAERGEPHGMIYVGEGYEAVYAARAERT
jgi:hypothetical protein